MPLIVVKLDPSCDIDDHIVLASQINLHSTDDADLCNQVLGRINKLLGTGIELPKSSVPASATKPNDAAMISFLNENLSSSQLDVSSGKLISGLMGGNRRESVVIGISPAHDVYYRFGFNDHVWKQGPGKMKYASVGPLGLFACNASDEVYYLNGVQWQRLAGSLKCISAGKVFSLFLAKTYTIVCD